MLPSYHALSIFIYFWMKSGKFYPCRHTQKFYLFIFKPFKGLKPNKNHVHSDLDNFLKILTGFQVAVEHLDQHRKWWERGWISEWKPHPETAAGALICTGGPALSAPPVARSSSSLCEQLLLSYKPLILCWETRGDQMHQPAAVCHLMRLLVLQMPACWATCLCFW